MDAKEGRNVLQQGKEASRLTERTSTADLMEKRSERGLGSGAGTSARSTKQLRLDGERRIDGEMRVLDLVAMWEDDIDQ